MAEIYESILHNTIIDIAVFYNEQYNETQVKLLIDELFSQMFYLTDADFQCFKAKCISGYYPLKFRLTPNVIIEWVKMYLDERMEAYVDLNRKTVDNNYSEGALEILKSFADKVNDKHNKIIPVETSYQIELKNKVNNAYKEFNKIGEGQDSEWGLRSKRFISQNGKMISFDEYLKTI